MLQRIVMGCLVSCAVACAALIQGQMTGRAASGDQDVAYQVNLAHAGSLSGDALAPPLAKQWSVNLGGPVSYPLIAGGLVYVTVGNTASSTSTLYALNEKTGATVWTAALGGTRPWAAAAFDAGNVFAVNYNGLLQAFNGSTGSSLWSAQMMGQFYFSSPPIAANGTVYLGGAESGGTVYAVNETNGAVLWTKQVMNGDSSSPALSGTNVYVSYACPQTYDFSTAGALVWHYSGPCEGGGGSTPVVSGGEVYVRDAYGGVDQGDVLDAASGQITNTFLASAPPAFSGSTGAFLSGVSSTTGGTLRGQNWSNPAAPTTLWSFAGDGTLDSAPLIVNSTVYIGGSSGNLYGLDLQSGQQTWTATVGAGIPRSNEGSVAGPTTGLGAGEGFLLVPAGNVLVAYSGAQAPTVTGVSFNATEGSSFSGNVATFTDPNPAPSGDTATIAWGDGTTSAGVVGANGSGGYTVTGSHAYAEEGSFATSVSVSNGAASRSGGATATVADAALSSSGLVLPNGSRNVSFTRAVLSFSDADPGCALSDYSATIAWGDGTTSTGTISTGSGACSYQVSGTHAYASMATFSIRTTVHDAGGSTTANNSTITVKNKR